MDANSKQQIIENFIERKNKSNQIDLFCQMFEIDKDTLHLLLESEKAIDDIMKVFGDNITETRYENYIGVLAALSAEQETSMKTSDDALSKEDKAKYQAPMAIREYEVDTMLTEKEKSEVVQFLQKLGTLNQETSEDWKVVFIDLLRKEGNRDIRILFSQVFDIDLNRLRACLADDSRVNTIDGFLQEFGAQITLEKYNTEFVATLQNIVGAFADAEIRSMDSVGQASAAAVEVVERPKNIEMPRDLRIFINEKGTKFIKARDIEQKRAYFQEIVDKVTFYYRHSDFIQTLQNKLTFVHSLKDKKISDMYLLEAMTFHDAVKDISDKIQKNVLFKDDEFRNAGIPAILNGFLTVIEEELDYKDVSDKRSAVSDDHHTSRANLSNEKSLAQRISQVANRILPGAQANQEDSYVAIPADELAVEQISFAELLQLHPRRFSQTSSLEAYSLQSFSNFVNENSQFVETYFDKLVLLRELISSNKLEELFVRFPELARNDLDIFMAQFVELDFDVQILRETLNISETNDGGVDVAAAAGEVRLPTLSESPNISETNDGGVDVTAAPREASWLSRVISSCGRTGSVDAVVSQAGQR